MDLGYAQILVLLIWQSLSGINIEGGERGRGGFKTTVSVFALYRTINCVIVCKCNITLPYYIILALYIISTIFFTSNRFNYLYLP